MWTASPVAAGVSTSCRRSSFPPVDAAKRLRAASVFIANIGAVGLPPFYWGPHIRPDDIRLISVLYLVPGTLFDYLESCLLCSTASQLPNPHITYLTAKQSVAIFANRPLPVQGDGEITRNWGYDQSYTTLTYCTLTAYVKNSSLGLEKSPTLV